MSGKTEFRTFRSGSLRSSQSDEGSMIISGRALSYNVLSGDLGGFKERIAPGAFSKHLATKPDVLCRREHQSAFLLGKTSNGTLTLQDSPDGLNFRCVIDPRDPIAVSTHAAVRSGLLECMSFAFSVDGGDGEAFDSATDDDGNSCVRRTVKRAHIFDVAPVVQPAYPKGTTISARAFDYSTVRSAPALNIDAANRRLLAAIGNRLAQEKRRDDLRRRLYPTAQELEQEREEKRTKWNLDEARRIARELLGE